MFYQQKHERTTTAHTHTHHHRHHQIEYRFGCVRILFFFALPSHPIFFYSPVFLCVKSIAMLYMVEYHSILCSMALALSL